MPAPGSPRPLPLWHRARALRDTGRESEAITTLEEALALLPADHTLPEGVFAATVLQVRAELAAMTGRYADADADVRAARRALGQTRDEQYALTLMYADALALLAADLTAPNAASRGYRALVTAELVRATGEAGITAWQAAVEAWKTAVEHYPLAYAWLRHAEVVAAPGDRQAAGRSVRRAHALASRVGATPIAAEAAALARRIRLSLDDPVAEAVAPAAEDPLARFGLTDREREILVLLAGGRSNPQIAEALFISPKTASVHVSNILAKLGVDGRVEAAAVAHRLGVTG